MGDSFIAYLQQLELMVFFCGYPLLYALVIFFSRNEGRPENFRSRMSRFLPYAYALIGTLYLGLQLKNLYPDYSIYNIRHTILHPYLTIWGLLSLLFWIPAISRRKVLSLFHSLVFFFFLLRDIVLQIIGSLPNNDLLQNDMRVYITSFLLNVGAFIIILILSFLLFSTKRKW